MIIAGAIATILGLIISNWDSIKATLEGAVDWMTSKTDWVKEHFGVVGEAIWAILINVVQTCINIFDGLFTGIKEILDGIITVFKGIFNGDMSQVLEGLTQIFQGAFDTIWSIVDGLKSFVVTALTNLFDWLESKTDWIKENFGALGESILGTITSVIEEYINMFNGLFSGLKNVFYGVLEIFKGIFNGDMKQVLNRI